MNFKRFKLVLSMLFGYCISPAQDLALTAMLYPEPGQAVHLMFVYEIDFVVKNTGTTVVNSSTPYTFSLIFDGVISATYNPPAGLSINPGDSAVLTINTLTFSTPNSQLNTCLSVNLTTDINRSNDTTCNLMPFSVDNNIDIGPKFIDILLPSVDSAIEVKDVIYRLGVTMDNYGTVTLPREYSLKIETKMYGQTKTFNLKTAGAFGPGSEADLILFGSQPMVQATPGTFQICATLVGTPDDVNPSNDEYCQVFYAYDLTSVTSINTNEEVASYYHNNFVQISSLTEEALNMEIITTSGQVALTGFLKPSAGKGSINVSSLSPGIYIFKVSSSKGLVHTNSFSID